MIYDEEINLDPIFNYTNYPLSLGIVDSYSLIYENESSIVVPIDTFRYFDENMNFKIEQLPIANCSLELMGLHSVLFIDYLSIIKNTVYCIDIPKVQRNLTLWGIFGDIKTQSLINFNFKKCENDTSKNKTDCLPIELINKKLTDSFIFINYIDHFIADKNVTFPGNSFLNSGAFAQSPTLYKKYFLKFKQVNYFTDVGYVFKKLFSPFFT